jgi:hypothetical protein
VSSFFLNVFGVKSFGSSASFSTFEGLLRFIRNFDYSFDCLLFCRCFGGRGTLNSSSTSFSIGGSNLVVTIG